MSTYKTKTCTSCNISLCEGMPFHRKQGRILCLNCDFECNCNLHFKRCLLKLNWDTMKIMTLTKCYICETDLKGKRCFRIGSRIYCSDCESYVKCDFCHSMLKGKPRYELDGKILCNDDYEKLEKSHL